MYRLTFLFSILIALNASAKTDNDTNYLNSNSEEQKLEKLLFDNIENSNSMNFNINTIEVIEIEEDVELGFDTAKYLPENFNALKGKHDLDLKSIEVVEPEEEVELNFDTANYLPANFNALKGKHDLDWNSIELIELEEEVELDFDTEVHLPENFNPYSGMTKDLVEVCFN